MTTESHERITSPTPGRSTLITYDNLATVMNITAIDIPLVDFAPFTSAADAVVQGRMVVTGDLIARWTPLVTAPHRQSGRLRDQ